MKRLLGAVGLTGVVLAMPVAGAAAKDFSDVARNINSYCGRGNLKRCRTAISTAIEAAGAELETDQG